MGLPGVLVTFFGFCGGWGVFKLWVCVGPVCGPPTYVVCTLVFALDLGLVGGSCIFRYVGFVFFVFVACSFSAWGFFFFSGICYHPPNAGPGTIENPPNWSLE